MKFSTLFVVFFVLLTFIGCSRRPAAMPATFPCQITITDGGTPQVNYDVGLHSVTGNGSLSIKAHTNSSGVAAIKTQLADYIAKGAPAGSYKVTVEKQVELPPDGVDTSKLSRDELTLYLIKRSAEAENYRVVPVQFSKADSTPFGLKIEKGGKTQWTFDLKDSSK